MNYYNAGYAAAQLVITLLVLAGICVGIVAIVRVSRKAARPPTADAYWFAAFALMPGERCGFVWQAMHVGGQPMIATITSIGTFALNYHQPQPRPLRLRPEGVTLSLSGVPVSVPGALEPMVEVTLSPVNQAPVTFLIVQSGASALAAWAIPAS